MLSRWRAATLQSTPTSCASSRTALWPATTRSSTRAAGFSSRKARRGPTTSRPRSKCANTRTAPSPCSTARDVWLASTAEHLAKPLKVRCGGLTRVDSRRDRAGLSGTDDRRPRDSTEVGGGRLEAGRARQARVRSERGAGRGGAGVAAIIGLARLDHSWSEGARRAGAGARPCAPRRRRATMGDPMRPPTWVSKSREKLASALNACGHDVSPNTVGRLLVDELAYSRQVNRKTRPALASGAAGPRSRTSCMCGCRAARRRPGWPLATPRK
jgi:hypothetical protein